MNDDATEIETAGPLKVLAPYLVATTVLSVALTMGLLRFAPGASASTSLTVVSFDVLKYTNAQRAVASTFLKPSADLSHTNELLLKLSERTRQAITEVAGPGTLVVLKQAVVQGQTQDITDAVLRKLGLPNNVPTADAAAAVLEDAPTMLMVPPAKRTYDSSGPGAQNQALP